MKKSLPLIAFTCFFIKTVLGQSLLIDNSYGTNGKVVKTLPGDALPSAVASQKDGKIIVAGYHGWYMSHWFVLCRFNADGSVDSTYGLNGNATPNVPPREYQTFNDIEIQADGKAIAVGTLEDSLGNGSFFITRFLENGQTDSTFGLAGIAQLGPGGCLSMALQRDGKIIVGGIKPDGPVKFFTLIRCHTNGSMDSSFGTNGVVATDLGGGPFYPVIVSSINIQHDGKILAAGPKNGANPSVMLRYTNSGVVDSSFGTNGIISGFPYSIGSSPCLQNDGKILVVGNSEVIRFHQNGIIDSTFKISKRASNVGVDSLGRIVLIGGHFIAADAMYKFLVSMYDSAGVLLDTVITDFGGDDNAKVLCFQPDGKIVVVGYTYRGISGTNPAFAIARYSYGVNTRVKNILNNIPISLSPNPATTSLTIQSEITFPPQTTFELFDLSGRMVLQEELRDKTTRVELNELSKGVYLYSVVRDREKMGAGKLAIE